ncbi:MAG: heme-binding protein [Alphaproteobacteria bacterium]|nr:heme-binding protein [Alphaproteobacteria bacterium]MBU1516459.1 heme-binding protein [Alphaproteobacteria bacterium]MBU2094216.1 heme-binding protein [Alphaproteobacteria bacterium]MBU2154207.1 heme-binding protein [Alphaproteobacteria bacterium]MBU2307386.1 heme-binding protein [Alphaproteobacteria bacterium]
MSSVSRWAVSVAALALASCGGGGGGSGGGTTTPPPTTPPPSAPAYTLPAAQSLSAADVQQVIAQAVAEAKARNLPAVIAVTDRVGNVLAVYSMTGARANTTLRAAPNGQNMDIQGAVVPAAAGAIAKAITGAYLSSGGNAFSTRTASQIVQEHFPPAPSTVGLEGGPLFGVQFSQLPCSDVVTRTATASIGPRRSPLGLSADPGGFPLYKNGVLVGGVGIMADGDYGFDRNILDTDDDPEEAIAYAAATGFDAPIEIRAERVTVDGTSLRFSDATAAGLRSVPASAPAFATLPAGTGTFTAVTGYYVGGGAIAGATYGTEASGLRLATTAEFSIASAMVLSNGAGANRFPIRAGTDAADGLTPLSDTEVRAVLEEAFTVMSRARGQIRRPLDSKAQVSISVVDSRGQILGIVRAPDAPIFGIDVAVQKARTTALMSGAAAASDLLGDPSADVRGFVQKVRDFFPDPTALTGKTAFAAKAIGNLSRPYFPDGEVGRPNGPLSRPIAQWSPLSTGLQSALVLGNIGQHVNFVTGVSATDTAQRCTFLPDVAPGQNRLQNGLQIFSGSVPIYRGNRLVGSIGVSGDGIDQDDMISFLGAHNAGLRVGGIGNAPAAIRSDTLLVGPTSTRLRYVGCPFAPFLDTNDQNVCQGK